MKALILDGIKPEIQLPPFPGLILTQGYFIPLTEMAKKKSQPNDITASLISDFVWQLIISNPESTHKLIHTEIKTEINSTYIGPSIHQLNSEHSLTDAT